MGERIFVHLSCCGGYGEMRRSSKRCNYSYTTTIADTSTIGIFHDYSINVVGAEVC